MKKRILKHLNSSAFYIQINILKEQPLFLLQLNNVKRHFLLNCAIEKDLILKYNSIKYSKRFKEFFGRKGYYPGEKDGYKETFGLFFHERLIYPEASPEPNNIEWEFIYKAT